MKLQVIVLDGVEKEIDEQARRRGISRSAYCAQAIMQVLEHDRLQQAAFDRLRSGEAASAARGGAT